MTIREMCARAQATSVAKGFVTEDPRIDQKLLLAVGELVEAQNEIRNGNRPESVYFHNGEPNGELRFGTVPAVMPFEQRGDIRVFAKPEGFPIELADAVIRIGQLAEHLGIDLEAAIELKMAYNDTRPVMHGGKKF